MKWAVAVVAVVVAVAPSACGGDDAGTTTGPRLSTVDIGDGSHDALLQGRLDAAERDGWLCFVVRAPDGTSTRLVWPDGWTAAVGPARLLDGDGREVARAGEQVDIGGGLTDDPPDDACAGTGTQAWVGQISGP